LLSLSLSAARAPCATLQCVAGAVLMVALAEKKYTRTRDADASRVMGHGGSLSGLRWLKVVSLVCDGGGYGGSDGPDL